MLAELRVENFAIIEKLTITFENGLTVITGETGAGKSIIIDAIGLIVGGRSSSEFVRHGAERAEIEALFVLPSEHHAIHFASELGIEVEEDLLVLRRQISATGKSICRVNGKIVTLTQLRDIGSTLIDIHGQHEHQSLMEPDHHLSLLDSFGGDELKIHYQAYLEDYEALSKRYKEYQKLSQNEQETARRLDLIQYQLKEIADANLKEDEEEILLEERKLLSNYERLFQSIQISYEALSGEGKGLDWLGQAMHELELVHELDQELKTIYDAVSNSYYILEENVYTLRDRMENLEYQPERLDEIELRLNDINMLKRKYGQTIPEVLNYYQKIEAEYDQLINKDAHVEKLQKEIEEGLEKLYHKAMNLSKIREETAKDLTRSINHELKDLHMEKATFKIDFINQTNFDEKSFSSYYKHGIDKTEFLISTNPGEPLKPLVKIASGGELSRIMLAIKTILKETRGMTSIIFDEVDTGVSGRVAQAMAEKIHHLSSASQVFCITHLPQVAAMADHHLFIAKQVRNERTTTRVEKLPEYSRVEEIGRMISGVEVTDLTRQHAKELLKLAEELKG